MDLNRNSANRIYSYPIVREKDGYILNPSVLKDYQKKGVKLIITVDFGISNPLNFSVAQKLGLKLVVCDHHETTFKSFSAPAVDPKRDDSQYPFRELAGVGVTFKLAQSLYQYAFNLTPEEFYSLKREFFSLLLIGTIADRVALIEENRIFCNYGLRIINEISTGWINFFKKNGELKLSHITTEIIPILASAAYTDPNLGINMLTKSEDEVAEIVENLKGALQIRRSEADKLFQEAVSASKNYDHIVISVIPFTKQHYLGSVAARLKDYFKKTTIVIGCKDGKCYGELRSFNLDLYKMLYEFRPLFIDFGGHKKAAGFSMPEENLDTLIQNLTCYTTKSPIKQECNGINPEAFLDRSCVAILSPLAPFGEANPAPILIDNSGCYTIDNSFNIISLEI